MALYLYTVNSKGTAVLDEEAVKLAPKLGKLKKEELLFVILFTDYASPYNQQPTAERLARAKRHVWGKEAPEKIDEAKHIIEAIEEFKGLIYDEDREMLRNYKSKIVDYSEIINNETDPRKVKAYDDAVSVLENRVVKIEEKLRGKYEQQFVLKGDRRMSQIEMWQQNQREYKKRRQRETQALNKAADETVEV